jgi:hypothetical protein
MLELDALDGYHEDMRIEMRLSLALTGRWKHLSYDNRGKEPQQEEGRC